MGGWVGGFFCVCSAGIEAVCVCVLCYHKYMYHVLYHIYMYILSATHQFHRLLLAYSRAHLTEKDRIHMLRLEYARINKAKPVKRGHRIPAASL